MMQRYYFFCNHVSFSNGFWVSVLRPPPQGLSVAPENHIFAPHALKGQKLLAQGIALGVYGHKSVAL